MRWSRSSLFLWLTCCASASPHPESEVPAARNVAPPERDALSLRLDQLVASLAPAGFTRLPLAGRGFLVEGASRSHALEIQPGVCLTVVAVGSVGVRDVDAQIYSPDGTVLAEDDEPDPHPIVQLCAQSRMRAYFVIKMYTGAGAYRFVGLRSSREALPRAIAAVRGGSARSEAHRSALDQRLEQLAGSLAERGFAARGEPATSILGAHDAVRFALPTEKSVCYTVVALAGDGVRNLDLALMDEDAQEIAYDTSSSRDGVTQFCSDTEETVSAELRMVSGSGEVRFAVFGGASENVGGAGRLWLGERRDRPSELPIEQAASAAREGLRRGGYELRPATGPSKIQQREVQSHTVSAPAGRCTAVVAVGGRGIARLRLSAFDPTGDPLVDPMIGIGSAGIRICPPRTVSARVDVEAQRGGGEVALVVGETAAGPAVRGGRALLGSRLQGLLDQSVASGYALAGEVVSGRMPTGGLRQLPASSGARCQRIVAATEGQGTEAHLYILDASGHRVAADHSSGGAAWIELCDAPGVAATVEIRVERGSGEIEYRVARLEKQ